MAYQLAALHETMPELERWLNMRLEKAPQLEASRTILRGRETTQIWAASVTAVPAGSLGRWSRARRSAGVAQGDRTREAVASCHRDPEA